MVTSFARTFLSNIFTILSPAIMTSLSEIHPTFQHLFFAWDSSNEMASGTMISLREHEHSVCYCSGRKTHSSKSSDSNDRICAFPLSVMTSNSAASNGLKAISTAGIPDCPRSLQSTSAITESSIGCFPFARMTLTKVMAVRVRIARTLVSCVMYFFRFTGNYFDEVASPYLCDTICCISVGKAMTGVALWGSSSLLG